MRKILHLRTIRGKGGGPEKTLLSTPRHLGPEYEVQIACLRPRRDPEYNMPERARGFGVSLIDIPETGPVDPRAVFRLAAEVRQFRPHVLHAHDYKTDVLGVLLGRWFGIPTVTTLHGFGFLSGRLGLYHRLDRWALRRMHHSIAVSPDLHEFLAELGIPDGRRSLVEDGIDTEVYRRRMDGGECKRRFGFGAETLLVGAVGRLQPEKGFDLLIESASKLLEQGMMFNVVIAGDGPERDRLEALIQACGLSVALAAVGEWGQSLVGRTASLADLARGVLGGVAAAIVLRCVLVRPVHPEKVVGAGLVVVTVIGWAGYQYGAVFLDAFRAYRSFPVLADLRSRGAAERWRTESATVRRVAADGTEPAWVGELVFMPNEPDASWIVLLPVVRDWSAYRTLRCELFFRGEPLDLRLSIRDGRKVIRPQRRFDWHAHLAAGRHTIRIDLDAVARGGEFAPVDLARVQSFHFGLAGLRQPRTVVLERIYLE